MSQQLTTSSIQLKEYFFFFVVPVILYAGFATDFSFDFFEPYNLWRAYNEYFLSLIDGRLDVPVYAIGREGLYFDGKAYMYYGLLPALSRVFLQPFIDLQTVPASAFSVWLFSVIGALSLQASVLVKYKKTFLTTNAKQGLFVLLLLSLIIWFGSANFMILQKARLTHEPYAVSLCLVSIYIALLIRDDFFLKAPKSVMPYAILAGLCIHARMPTALALYCTTVLLMFVSTYHHVNQSERAGQFWDFVKTFVMKHAFALLVMFIFGLSILWMNYVRFGSPFSFMGKFGHYGFFLAGEGYSERMCSVVPKGDYAASLRVIPNTIIYLIGGRTLHAELTAALQTGFGRIGEPVIPILLLWLNSFCLLIMTLYYLIRNRGKETLIIFLLLLTISVGGIYQLVYPTISHRYTAELWPLFLFANCAFFCLVLQGKIKLNKFSIVLILGASLLSMSYNLYISFSSGYHYRSSAAEIYRYDVPAETVAKLESYDQAKIDTLIQAFHDGRKEGCKQLEK